MYIEDRRNAYSNAEFMDNYINCRYKPIQINSVIPVRLSTMTFNGNRHLIYPDVIHDIM